MAQYTQYNGSPEVGWTRFDNTNTILTYTGTWTHRTTQTGTYNTTDSYTSTTNDTLKFNFTGTGLRLISMYWSSFTDNIEVKIDGVLYSNFSQYSANNVFQVATFEVIGLANKEHYIEFKLINGAGKFFGIDAIDLVTGNVLKSFNNIIVINKILISLSDGTARSVIETSGNTNLALNKTATASSSSSGYLPSYAVDGKTRLTDSTSTGWQTSLSATQWWQVDLGNVYLINKYRLYNDAKGSGAINNIYDTGFDVYISTDGTNFTEIDSVRGLTSSTWVDKTLNSPVNARYIKITNMTSSSSYVEIGEFEVYEYASYFKQLPSSAEDMFINHGMDKTSVVDFSKVYTQKTIVNADNSTNIINGQFTLANELANESSISIVQYSDAPNVTSVTTTIETDPFTFYDEMGDSIDILYYTDDSTKTSAQLDITANYTPLDEINEDFDVVTWTNGVPEEQSDTVNSTISSDIIDSGSLYVSNEIDLTKGMGIKKIQSV